MKRPNPVTPASTHVRAKKLKYKMQPIVKISLYLRGKAGSKIIVLIFVNGSFCYTPLENILL